MTDEIPVLDLTGDENDDWMKKANPEYRKSELAIHEELSRRHRERERDKARKSKYDPLREYLASAVEHVLEITLSFAQLEHILGFELPLSAHKYRAWWANPSSPDHHTYAQAWLAAGWKVDTVDQDAEWVRFQRMR